MRVHPQPAPPVSVNVPAPAAKTSERGSGIGSPDALAVFENDARSAGLRTGSLLPGAPDIAVGSTGTPKPGSLSSSSSKATVPEGESEQSQDSVGLSETASAVLRSDSTRNSRIQELQAPFKPALMRSPPRL